MGIAELGIPGMVEKIESHMKAIAAERDKLDETISELKHLESNCDEAMECLGIARDALSELV